jgi:S-adenosyl-l-methionine hydroxide adenosyltransferase
MSKFIHAICDYAAGDLAWSEIISALAARHAETRPHITTVLPFDTVSTGFATAQLGMAMPPLRPEKMMIFANTAPRKDRSIARKNNAGEGLLYGVLSNGVEIVAVNSGHSLSFVKDELVELYETKAPDRGSQFRSRDFFPEIIAAVAAGDYDFKRRKLNPATAVKDAPLNAVAYIDCFGNLKTSIRAGQDLVNELVEGSDVLVTIGSTVRTATVASGSFNVKEGNLALSPGSSGHDRRFWELFKRGGSAWEEFNRPHTGDAISILAA